MGRSTPIDRLRAICLALPEAHEKVFGGHTSPTFRVRDKIFVMMNDANEMWCKARRAHSRSSSVPIRSASSHRHTSAPRDG